MKNILLLILFAIFIYLFYNSINNFYPYIDQPTDTSNKVAIIFPYRENPDQNRSLQLSSMLDYYREKNIPNIDLYVIEQNNSKPFNRGTLLNIGHDILKKTGKNYNNEVHHDIDMFPDDNMIKYFFNNDVTAIRKNKYQNEFVGGILMIPLNIFEKINGYTNNMWGWGYEDTNLASRLYNNNIKVYNPKSGKINELNHKRSNRSYMNKNKLINDYEILNGFESGLSDLNYTINSAEVINNVNFYKVDF